MKNLHLVLWIVFSPLVFALGYGSGYQSLQSKLPTEKGYHHLMLLLGKRDGVKTCEHLELDGSTCYTIMGNVMGNGIDSKATKVCGRNRDDASEKAAQWIEKNTLNQEEATP